MTEPAGRRTLIQILEVAGKEFGSDHAGRMAAALSYYTVFSLVPLLFLVLAMAGFVFDDQDLVDELVAEAGAVAGSEVAEVLGQLIDTVQAQATGALWIGITLSAYAASGIFQQVQAVLAVVFHVPEDRRRTGPIGWLVRRGVALVSALVLAVLAFTPIVAVAAVGWIEELVDGIDWLVTLVRLGVPVLSLLVLMGVVALSFQLLTSVDVPWRAAVRGGAATAAVGLAGAYGVGLYLGAAATTGTMGALGGLAVLLVFFNLMWIVFLLGAEVTKTYADYLTFGDIRPSSERVGSSYSADLVPPPREPAAIGAMFTFFSGLLIGWLGGRRR